MVEKYFTLKLIGEAAIIGFFVMVLSIGQIESVTIDHYTNETNYVTNGKLVPGGLYFTGYCTARNEEHAKKIVKDFRSKKLSEELGL